MDTQPTNREIMDAIVGIHQTVATLATHKQLTEAIVGVDKKLTDAIGGVKTELTEAIVGVKTELMDAILGVNETVAALATHLDKQIESVRTEMATKDSVDRKVDNAEMKLTAEIRKTDAKVGRLVDVLEKKDVLTVKDAHHVIVG